MGVETKAMYVFTPFVCIAFCDTVLSIVVIIFLLSLFVLIRNAMCICIYIIKNETKQIYVIFVCYMQKMYTKCIVSAYV